MALLLLNEFMHIFTWLLKPFKQLWIVYLSTFEHLEVKVLLSNSYFFESKHHNLFLVLQLSLQGLSIKHNELTPKAFEVFKSNFPRTIAADHLECEKILFSLRAIIRNVIVHQIIFQRDQSISVIVNS